MPFSVEYILFLFELFLFGSELLRGEDPVHLGLGQAQALHAERQDVLRKQAGDWSVPIETHQSHLEAVQEEAIAQERRP